MNPTAMFITSLLIVPGIGLLTWVWFAISQVETELHALRGFEGMHFEDYPASTDRSLGTRQ